MADHPKPGHALIISARVFLVFITLLWGTFTLVSGVGPGQGNGVTFWQNAPNALPWIGLGGLTLISFKSPAIGGVLVVLAGVASVFFFNAWSNPVVLFGVALPMVTCGLMLLLGASRLRG